MLFLSFELIEFIFNKCPGHKTKPHYIIYESVVKWQYASSVH